MIGTKLVEELVQAVALSHRVKGFKRCSLLLLAAPESGKTTITRAANCNHVLPVAVISGRSVVHEANTNPSVEFLLFNDMTTIRAMHTAAVNLLISLLNQCVQDERGIIAFAAKEKDEIKRSIGIIGCLPFKTFTDHRSRWREMGFISRMIPFAYEYGDELVAEIKDSIDTGNHNQRAQPRQKMPRIVRRPVSVKVSAAFTKEIRRLADSRAKQLGQLGIRLLQNYHCLVRAHALISKRTVVTKDDLVFLREVDKFVSVNSCTPLNGDHV